MVIPLHQKSQNRQNMEGRNHLQVNKHTKILVPASKYNVKADSRLLLPFTSGEKVGFINNEGEIIVQPKYSMYYGEIYDENDYIKVAVVETYGFPRSAGRVSTYKRSLYGLIDKDGVEVIEPVYLSMIFSIGGNELLLTVQRSDRKWGVVDVNGREIVPFGTYDWMDGFDHGYARVKLGHSPTINENKWGIINSEGDEVLPVVYSNIWNFYDKNRYTVRIEKDGVGKDFTLRQKPIQSLQNSDCGYRDDYGTHYGEYAGSYAQNVMGYSDDVINDAFEGDPDAYWNID